LWHQQGKATGPFDASNTSDQDLLKSFDDFLAFVKDTNRVLLQSLKENRKATGDSYQFVVSGFLPDWWDEMDEHRLRELAMDPEGGVDIRVKLSSDVIEKMKDKEHRNAVRSMCLFLFGQDSVRHDLDKLNTQTAAEDVDTEMEAEIVEEPGSVEGYQAMEEDIVEAQYEVAPKQAPSSQTNKAQLAKQRRRDAVRRRRAQLKQQQKRASEQVVEG